jgi:endonuclease YncB( thermonuclease family)
MGNCVSSNQYDQESVLLKKTDIVVTVPRQYKTIPGIIVRVLDGDTAEVEFLLGGERLHMSMRFAGVDTPQISRSKNNLENQCGDIVTEYVKKLINGRHLPIVIQKWDSFGGLIGHIYLDKKKPCTISQRLLEIGYAKQYNGREKKLWTNDELKVILLSRNSNKYKI